MERLHHDYVLVTHPFPTLEGELLIYQYPEPASLNNSSHLLYKDFSLKKRMKTKIYSQKQLLERKKKMDEDNLVISKLNCLEIDVKEPLSTADWENMSLIVSEINALAWVQILPVGKKAS